MDAPDDPMPTDFTMPIAFDEVFIYDPNAGSLLVDVTFSGFDRLFDVDNQSFSDGITRLVVGGATAINADNVWPILAPMQFTVTTVPEPASGTTWILAGLTLSMARLRKSRRI